MARPGGPGLLPEDQRKRFLDAITIGSYAEVAARLAGIPPSTLWRWLEQGREAPSGQYREFWEAVKEAEAKAEHTAVGAVRRGGRDWTAHMTFLERRFRDRWSRPAQTVYMPGAGEAASAPGAATAEPVIIPVADRVTGILDALQAAGKLDGRGSEAADPATKPVRGNGRSPHTNGTG